MSSAKKNEVSSAKKNEVSSANEVRNPAEVGLQNNQAVIGNRNEVKSQLLASIDEEIVHRQWMDGKLPDPDYTNRPCEISGTMNGNLLDRVKINFGNTSHLLPDGKADSSISKSKKEINQLNLLRCLTHHAILVAWKQI